MTKPMSPGVMSSSSRASATDLFTTRQLVSQRSGPPTPLSTSAAPPGNLTTKPCTGQSSPSTPRRVASVSRLISRVTVLESHGLPPAAHGNQNRDHRDGEKDRRREAVHHGNVERPERRAGHA